MASSSSRSILYVAPIDFSSPGAAALHVAAIVTEFAQRGHRVSLVVPVASDAPWQVTLPESVAIHRVHTGGLFGSPSAGALACIPRAMRIAKTEHVDVAYLRFGASTAVVALALRAIGKCRVVSEHNGWLAGELAQMGHGVVVRTVARWSQTLDGRVAHAVVVVSSPIRRHLVEAGVKADKISVIENGTDIEAVKPLATADRPRRANDSHVVGFLGGLFAWQGLENAVRAMPGVLAEVPGTRLIIGGDGPDRTHLEELATSLGVSDVVSFEGAVDLADRNEFLHRFDVAVIPRDAAIAGLGMSPIKLREYAAAGLPVVAPRLPGIEEFEPDGWIALYEPGDLSEMSRRIVEMLRDPQRRQFMGQTARAAAEDSFSWSATADSIMPLLWDITPDVGRRP